MRWFLIGGSLCFLYMTVFALSITLFDRKAAGQGKAPPEIRPREFGGRFTRPGLVGEKNRRL